MVFHQCQIRTFPICAKNFGRNIPRKSPVTSQRLPSLPFSSCLMKRFFIVKTNKPHPSESTAPVFTTKPSTTPSKTHPSLNPFPKIQLRLSHPLSTFFYNNMASHTRGQLVPDDNSRQVTFWPKRRRRFKVVDRSFPSLTPLFDQCSTSWPA